MAEKQPRDDENEDEIPNVDSVPPPGDPDADAYGAPTKVGEAAYTMLARGMAAYDIKSPPSKPPKPAKPSTLPQRPPPRPVAKLDDRSEKITPLPQYADDADVDPVDQIGTVVMAATASLNTAPPPLNTAPLPPLPASESVRGPEPEPPPPPPPPSRPALPVPSFVPLGDAGPASVDGTYPRARVVDQTRRAEILIGVLTFLAVAVPALAYILSR